MLKNLLFLLGQVPPHDQSIKFVDGLQRVAEEGFLLWRPVNDYCGRGCAGLPVGIANLENSPEISRNRHSAFGVDLVGAFAPERLVLF